MANCVAHTYSLPLSVLLKQLWTFPCKAALNETVSRWPSPLISANYTAAVNYSGCIAASLFLPLCSSGQVSGVRQTSHLSHTSRGSRMVICRGDGVAWNKNEASCSLKNRTDTWQCFIKLVVWGTEEEMMASKKGLSLRNCAPIDASWSQCVPIYEESSCMKLKYLIREHFMTVRSYKKSIK